MITVLHFCHPVQSVIINSGFNVEMPMSTPIFIDEPLIVPYTPGEVLVRSSQVLGALSQGAHPNSASLETARQALLTALESGDQASLAQALQTAQQQLLEIYESVKEDSEVLASLGFPSAALLADEMSIEPVDVSKVNVTYTITGKQVLASISFPRAANAKFYWLHEVRHFTANPAERVEDPILESHSPLFDRVRLVPGKRILRIKSRNLSTSAMSDEFTLDVPQP